jgi:hypothetical protein
MSSEDVAFLGPDDWTPQAIAIDQPTDEPQTRCFADGFKSPNVYEMRLNTPYFITGPTGKHTRISSARPTTLIALQTHQATARSSQSLFLDMSPCQWQASLLAWTSQSPCFTTADGSR